MHWRPQKVGNKKLAGHFNCGRQFYGFIIWFCVAQHIHTHTHNNGSKDNTLKPRPSLAPAQSPLAWHFRCETAFLLCGLIFLMPTTLCWLPACPPATSLCPCLLPFWSRSTQFCPALVQLNIIVNIKKPQFANCCCCYCCKMYLPIAAACRLLLLFVATLTRPLPTTPWPSSFPFFAPFLWLFFLSFIVPDRSQRKLLVDTQTRYASVYVRVCTCLYVCACVCWPAARQFVFSLSGQLKAV